jgi:hypothetical protein
MIDDEVVLSMKRNLQPVAKVASDGPFTEPQLRWWIFKAADNGLNSAGAIVRVSRRVYIDIDAFERWINAQNERAAA